MDASLWNELDVTNMYLTKSEYKRQSYVTDDGSESNSEEIDESEVSEIFSP